MLLHFDPSVSERLLGQGSCQTIYSVAEARWIVSWIKHFSRKLATNLAVDVGEFFTVELPDRAAIRHHGGPVGLSGRAKWTDHAHTSD